MKAALWQPIAAGEELLLKCDLCGDTNIACNTGAGYDPNVGFYKRKIVLAAGDGAVIGSVPALVPLEYDVLQAKSRAECHDILSKKGRNIAAALVGIAASKQDDFELLSDIAQMLPADDIPVIAIAQYGSEDSVGRAYRLGAADCIGAPFCAPHARLRIENILKLYDRQRFLRSEIARQNAETRRSHRLLADISGSIIGYGSGESNMHLKRTAWIVSLLLDRLVHKTDKYGLTTDVCNCISAAAALHDIGKVGIKRAILNKPGKLTDEEFAAVRRHTVIGEEMIRSIDCYESEPFLKIAAQICRWHHERYDGGGYPDGLTGDDIPIAAQVVGIADVYDALVSDRVYSPAVTGEKAFEMIANGECGAFSLLMLDCLSEIKPVLLKEEIDKTI